MIELAEKLFDELQVGYVIEGKAIQVYFAKLSAQLGNELSKFEIGGFLFENSEIVNSINSLTFSEIRALILSPNFSRLVFVEEPE